MARQMDVRRWPQMRARLATAFAAHTRDHSRLASSDACVSPVLEFAHADPHNASRRVFTQGVRGGGIWVSAAPALSRTPALPPTQSERASDRGKQTETVLREWLPPGESLP
jgi:alpha-methylacyl-CoA racemase